MLTVLLSMESVRAVEHISLLLSIVSCRAVEHVLLVHFCMCAVELTMHYAYGDVHVCY